MAAAHAGAATMDNVIAGQELKRMKEIDTSMFWDLGKTLT
jgi:hypothetical protein